jgi:Leucine-rich repeat (LRR) protein
MPGKLRIQVNRMASLAGLLSIALGLPACNNHQHSELTVTAASEAGFAEQAEAVRDWRSDQIRLDHASVGDEQLAKLDGLEDQLRRINISHSDITDAGLARIARMRNLTQLRLASEKVTDAGLACLAELKELRHLHLIDMPISDTGLAHLHKLKNLESLYLDGTGATDEGMKGLVEALPSVHVHFDGGHYRADPHADDHGK